MLLFLLRRHPAGCGKSKAVDFLQTAVILITVMNDIETLKDLLDNHDWYYHFSDDPRWYHAGADSAARINNLMKNATAEMKMLYNEYHARIYNRSPFVPAGYTYEAPYKI